MIFTIFYINSGFTTESGMKNIEKARSVESRGGQTALFAPNYKSITVYSEVVQINWTELKNSSKKLN